MNRISGEESLVPYVLSCSENDYDTQIDNSEKYDILIGAIVDRMNSFL